MRSICIMITTAALALAAPQAARAGFWGDLKHSLGQAADNAERDGARAIDAIGEGAGNAADHVTGGPGGPAEAAPQPVARPDPAAKDLSKDPAKQ
jgi:hypothetical protein